MGTSSSGNPGAIPPDPSTHAVKPELRGWQKLQLMNDIATGEETYAQLAEKYERSPSSIGQFAMRNKVQIQAIRDANGEAIAALWIAQKANRIAEYQADAERLAAEMSRPEVTEDPDGTIVYKQDGASTLARARAHILRSVAEELGHLTVRVDTNQTVRYVVTGMDPDALK